MEVELKKLYDTVASIHDEMFYLRERYGKNTSSVSNYWLSICSVSYLGFLIRFYNLFACLK